ncbi:hypothetical protein [[Micrococcus luteus] ATCC 49442]|uniref:hypothetical protein n=1 Tax=[Micrococcus luteus] ATCC 49442 TaxID=2698727 RepID=UPI0013DD3320|nr:hypothetical protein [[Micrococcus luteus] ATCC 49442]
MTTAQTSTGAYAIFNSATGKVEKDFKQATDAETAEALSRSACSHIRCKEMNTGVLT